MKIQDQHLENDITNGIKTVSYIANSRGEQELVSSSTWQPVNIANRQAWLEIEKLIESSNKMVAAGKVSCLHYYMTANQMDTGLLAKYTFQFRWLVRLHIIPFFFKRLHINTVNKYAEIFGVSAEDLIQGKLQPPVYNCRKHRDQLND